MTEKEGLISKFKQFFGKGNSEEMATENMQRLSELFDQLFGPRLDKIVEIDAKRIAISKVIGNDREFLSRDPNLSLIALVQDTYRESNGNPILFLRRLRAKREWIRRFEGELADKILQQLERTEREFGSQETFRILIDIYFLIASNPDKGYIVGFMKTPPHNTELQTAISSIRNARAKQHIRATINALTDEELGYLIRYHSEAASWERSAINEDIPFFAKKINDMLYGQVEPYLGLVYHFGDEKIEQQLKSSPAYLQLTKYNLMMMTLRRLRAKIATYQTGNWDQFEDVYNNVKKWANTFIREFGNEKIAQELFQEKKEFREYPERWLRDIDRTIAEMISIQYRREKVIGPFVGEIERIFNIRVNELRGMAKPEIAELKEALKPLIKLEKNVSDKISAEIENFRKRIKVRMEQIRKEFDILSNRCVDALKDFVDAKARVIHQGINQQINIRARNAQSLIRRGMQYIRHTRETISSDLEVTANDPIRITSLLFSLDKAFRATIRASNNLRAIAGIFSQAGISAMIDELNRYMGAAESSHNELDIFIEENLKFLIQPSTEQRRDDYGRARAA